MRKSAVRSPAEFCREQQIMGLRTCEAVINHLPDGGSGQHYAGQIDAGVAGNAK